MAREMIPITINGREVEAEAGSTLLKVLRGLGLRIPTLCHDDRLTPYGGCRLCVVARRDGRGGLVPSCSAPIERGMVIETDCPEVVESRRGTLELLLLDHRMDCPVCERRGDCRFQDLLFEYGVGERRLPFDRLRSPRNETSPLIVRDNEKCVLCGKCARLCDEVQGVAEIGVVGRGLGSRVGTMLDRPLDCEFCGQCVDACPVGALVARPFVSDVPVWQRDSVTTTCSFCSCGCQLVVESHEGSIQRVTASTALAPNGGNLCVRGRFGWDLLAADERLVRPLIRRSGQLVEATWEEALAAVAARLRLAREKAQTIVALGSTRLLSEDAYLLQRLIRGVLGSPHVDAGIGMGVDALGEGMAPVTGRPCSTATFEDLRTADLVVVLRADPGRTHPLVKNELLAAARRGTRVVLAHGLSGRLGRHVSELRVKPGSEASLLHGVSRELLKEPSLVERGGDALPGFEQWRGSLEAYGPAVVTSLTGLQPPQVSKLAALLASARHPVLVVVTGRGIPGNGADVASAAASLTAVLGGGVLVLGERANVQGVTDAGLSAGWLPGWRRIDDAGARSEVARLCGEPVPDGRGWSAREALARSAAGDVDVLYLVGRDPIDVWPRAVAPRAAVENARFVVVQDAFLTDTARLADVVLPVTVLIEREGTLTGADGVERRARRAVAPPANLPGDGQVFVELARRLGRALPEGDALASEMRALLGDPPPPRVALRAAPPPPPVTEESGSLLLDPSPQLFHSGSVTRHSRTLQDLAPLVAARFHPVDARRLGLQGGEMLRVTCGPREVLLRARIDRSARPGSVMALWHSTGQGAGALVTDDGPAPSVEVRRSQ